MLRRWSYVLTVTMFLVSLLLTACGSGKLGAAKVGNGITAAKTAIAWPFVPSAGQHWAVVNGYGQGDHATIPGATYALDFALCSSITAQQTCDLSNGWDTTNTDGQPVSSPVTGRVLYIDGHSGADHGGGDSMCRTLGIQLARSDNSYEVLQLAHIERLKHYDASSQPDLSVGDAVTQGEHIGFVSAVSGGGCYGQSHHIHMELYSGSDTNRAAQPFTAKWAIAGCAFNEGSAHQGELVPCAHPSTTGPMAIRGKVTEFPLPTGGSGPDSITTGPDAALWFTESDGNRIGRSTTDGQIHEFPLPYNFAEHEAPFSTRAPGDIIVGPDGALWFTEGYAEQIGRITTDGQLHEFPLPSAQQGGGGRLLIGLTVGPDGALWFTERAAGRIGRITMSGQVREFSLPSGASAPDHITLGPDGALWFTESADTSNAIGRITPDGSVREFELPSGYAHPSGIAAGPDGAVWFTEVTGNRIGRITTTGEITEYSLPTANSYPGGITTGPDGALWFTESGGAHIGRITTSGQITEFPIPSTDDRYAGITTGPDGALWFIESNGVARLG